MNTYRCEWRIDIAAETPEEAAQKAEELMRGALLSCWTVIDEHGDEQNFNVPVPVCRTALVACSDDSACTAATRPARTVSAAS